MFIINLKEPVLSSAKLTHELTKGEKMKLNYNIAIFADAVKL